MRVKYMHILYMYSFLEIPYIDMPGGYKLLRNLKILPPLNTHKKENNLSPPLMGFNRGVVVCGC